MQLRSKQFQRMMAILFHLRRRRGPGVLGEELAELLGESGDPGMVWVHLHRGRKSGMIESSGVDGMDGRVRAHKLTPKGVAWVKDLMDHARELLEPVSAPAKKG